VIVHDAIIAPLVVVAALAVRRTGRRVPAAVIALVQSAVVVGVVMSMIVVPEIVAKAKGPKNDTVLPFDYAGRLSVMWLVIVVLTALAVVAYLVRTRRQKSRESTDQV
jgi:formate hydrogenlyase subunit 3/multisubunit Na+/H+ antiporter MnhD subunit